MYLICVNFSFFIMSFFSCINIWMSTPALWDAVVVAVRRPNSHSISKYMLFWWPPILLRASQSKRPQSERWTPVIVSVDFPRCPCTSTRPSLLCVSYGGMRPAGHYAGLDQDSGFFICFLYISTQQFTLAASNQEHVTELDSTNQGYFPNIKVYQHISMNFRVIYSIYEINRRNG